MYKPLPSHSIKSKICEGRGRSESMSELSVNHLRFLQVLFEYLEKTRKTFFRERGGCGRKAYSKELLPFTEKYPLVLPQGKFVFAGCQNPPLLPLLGNIQKGQVTSLSSLLLSLLQKLLFVNPFFNKPIPSYCYLYFPTFSPNTTNPSLSVSIHFLTNPSPAAKKKHTQKNSYERPVVIS